MQLHNYNQSIDELTGLTLIPESYAPAYIEEGIMPYVMIPMMDTRYGILVSDSHMLLMHVAAGLPFSKPDSTLVVLSIRFNQHNILETRSIADKETGGIVYLWVLSAVTKDMIAGSIGVLSMPEWLWH